MAAEECDPHDWYHDGVKARVDGCICRRCGRRAGPPPARAWVNWDDPEYHTLVLRSTDVRCGYDRPEWASL